MVDVLLSLIGLQLGVNKIGETGSINKLMTNVNTGLQQDGGWTPLQQAMLAFKDTNSSVLTEGTSTVSE